MIRAKAGFIVYGVHKDGLADPMGQPFIDDALVAASKKALTDRGIELVEHDVVVASKKEARAALAKMKAPFESAGIKDKLYSLFESDFWAEVQQSCLGCGVCTYLCPTCHCFDIVDEVQRSERVRNWDTCMFRIYSQEASGHNPRPTNVQRTRQRIMHKYAYFIELFEEIGCTGCGRCVRHCPVDLDIRHIIHSAQTRDES